MRHFHIASIAILAQLVATSLNAEAVLMSSLVISEGFVGYDGGELEMTISISGPDFGLDALFHWRGEVIRL